MSATLQVTTQCVFVVCVEGWGQTKSQLSKVSASIDCRHYNCQKSHQSCNNQAYLRTISPEVKALIYHFVGTEVTPTHMYIQPLHWWYKFLFCKIHFTGTTYVNRISVLCNQKKIFHSYIIFYLLLLKKKEIKAYPALILLSKRTTKELILTETSVVSTHQTFLFLSLLDDYY